MKYRSSRKISKTKRVFINFMYRMGMPVKNIKKMVGVSRATVYRHINR
jgi:transposase-like protein